MVVDVRSRQVTQIPAPPRTLPPLSFQPVFLGQSQGEGVPAQIECWDIEQLSLPSKVPARYRQRLAEFALHVEIESVWLYHERPQGPSLLQRVGHIGQWVGKQGKETLPFIGEALLWVVLGIAISLGLIGAVLLAAAVLPILATIGACILGVVVLGLAMSAGLDPVLVVKTKSGRWYELGRWT